MVFSSSPFFGIFGAWDFHLSGCDCINIGMKSSDMSQLGSDDILYERKKTKWASTDT
jgi:hypothetical protein